MVSCNDASFAYSSETKNKKERKKQGISDCTMAQQVLAFCVCKDKVLILLSNMWCPIQVNSVWNCFHNDLSQLQCAFSSPFTGLQVLHCSFLSWLPPHLFFLTMEDSAVLSPAESKDPPQFWLLFCGKLATIGHQIPILLVFSENNV